MGRGCNCGRGCTHRTGCNRKTGCIHYTSELVEQHNMPTQAAFHSHLMPCTGTRAQASRAGAESGHAHPGEPVQLGCGAHVQGREGMAASGKRKGEERGWPQGRTRAGGGRTLTGWLKGFGSEGLM